MELTGEQLKEESLEGFRLSPQQRRIWLSQQSVPGNLLQCAVLVEGPLEAKALKQAAQNIVDRHEILRTSFDCRTGIRLPFQVVADSIQPLWEYLDLTELDPSQLDSALDRVFQDHCGPALDASYNSFPRFSLIALSRDKHVLVACLSPLCSDSVTLDNLLTEISCSYEAVLRHEERSGNVLQYADYCAWLEQTIENGDEDVLSGRSYWRNQSQLPAITFKLPFQTRDILEKLWTPKSFVSKQDAEIMPALDSVAQQHGVSASDFLCACWSLLLWRLGGQQEIVSAVEFPGRSHDELQEALGLFAQWLPVRVHFSDGIPFSEILARVSASLREAGRWQDYYAENVIEPYPIGIGFASEEWPPKEHAGGVSFSLIKKRVSTGTFDLQLRCVRANDSFDAYFYYDPHLFSSEDIERLAAEFQTLLESAIQRPETGIGQLEILGRLEREQILINFNSTETDSCSTLCEGIHERFQQQAARTPEGIAVAYEGRQLSYGELEARANQLAVHLQSLGVGPETLTAIYVERSLDIIVALLGVLKAGGAYVPLDTGLPRQRVSVILNETRPTVVLTQRQVAESLPEYDGHLVYLDTDWPAICERDAHPPRSSGVRSGSLAYVLFTSGSTATPKGVAVEHRQLLNYVDAILDRLNLPAGASYACVSTFAADLGNTAIFSALCSGGTLHIVSQERASDPEGLAQYFSLHSIDCLKIVPSHLEALLNASSPETILPKRRLVLGGEALSWDLVKKIEQLAPNCAVLNHYGPTETTVGATTYWIGADQMDHRAASVPIGRPLANTKLYLLNSHLQPVPISVTGEIFIGGAGVARGYLNRPDLTAERFIPSPFVPGARLYRTGDLGRYLSDGSIEFLGRTDHQIKIRGFRVELGEIEAVLQQYPNVQHAVVGVDEHFPGNAKIVAYIVTSHRKVDSSGLRDFLKTRLPDYMVPSAFVVLDALPLTSNGKVDRSRLSQLGRPEVLAGKRSAAALNPLELVLAGIFCEVLHTQHVDVDSDFFDLGGHSLLAIQVLSQIRRLLNTDLPLRVLFEKPTVGGIAEAILTNEGNAARIESAAQQVLISANQEQDFPIAVRKDRDLVPLSSTQEQMWFLNQLAPGSVSYNMCHAFHLRGPLHLTALERSLGEIVRRHESLRTTFVSIEGVPLQVIAPLMTVTLPVLELSDLASPERAIEAKRVAAEESRRPFDLARGPLLRIKLVRLGQEEHTLLIAMHHIISDGWSWGVFLKELSVLYEAFSEERPSPLSELTIQYGDFTQFQHERLKREVLEDRVSYWTQRLKNAPAQLELLTDRPRGAVQSLRGAIHSEMFPQALKEKLGVLGREEGATLFMTLFAAFNALLFRWSGQEDIVVGSTIAGRDRAELEPLIGLFINTLVLRTDLSGNPTFRELLRRVREVALEAYANQEVPFNRLMERQPKRSLGNGTLFQVLFLLHQGTSEHELALPGLAVTKIPVEMGMGKFALSVSMVEKTNGLSCSITYQTDLFDAATIQRFVAQFQTILEGIVADPNARISELPVLSNDEHLKMVVTWNNTKGDYPRDKCIHELFQEQVERTPDATAVIFAGGRVSYRELDRKADQLAQHLRDLGVDSGTLVVVCMERSLDAIVAVLGVLKAGGAYVPLDPKHSIERLGWVLRDTDTPVFLTHRRVVAALTTGLIPDKVEVVCLDDPSGYGGRNHRKKLGGRLTPDHPAYLIYTSGSTGTPKGVEITQRSLVNFAVSSAATFDLQASDRVLQFASLSFDTAVEEIFPCLIRGATLVLRTDRMLESASVFLEQCRQWRITILNLPTVYWHELTESITSEGLTLPGTLRLVILGGDKALAERVAQWRTCSNGRVRLLNEYGPTEATVVATLQELGGFPQENTWGREVPIGRPIANVQTYVLDRDLNPVPIGVCGELYIGGTCLAMGYHGRPDLTAESFIPNPFGNAGERLYKTGDVARYLPDGAIDFVGRLDYQAKIRGFRVEPAEVEAALTENCKVHQVVVIAGPGTTGSDNQLVAYVVLAPGAEATAEDLRGFLKTQLPEYMLPSAFVFLDALPLTISGKIDRRALPQADQNRPESKHVVDAARTPLEQELMEEWEKLLSARPIGVRSNFFDLGGHSLLGVRLIARIEKRFGKCLPVAALFESPTIEQLAILLEQQNFPDSWSSLIPVQPKGSKVPFFWVHGDSSNAVLPAYLGADQPLYGLEHQSLDGRKALYTRVDEIAKHYLSEVRSVCKFGPYLLGGYSFGAVVAFEMAQQLRREGEEVALLFLLDPPGKKTIENSSPLGNEVLRHLGELASLAPRETLRYLFPRIKAKLGDEISSRIRKSFKKLRLKVYTYGQGLLPPSLRSAYILNVYRQALLAYVPHQYSGRVRLVKAEGVSYQPRLDWSRLLAGDQETYELQGDHMDLRNEPYVRMWAERLKESLNRAESLRTRNPVI